MSLIALNEQGLIEEVQQLAEQEGKAADEVVADAVREHLAAHWQKRIWADTEAWYRMPAEERRRYAGRFVAVVDGQVLDHDADRLALYQRMRKRFGRRPVLIVEGGDQPMPVYRVSGARRAGVGHAG